MNHLFSKYVAIMCVALPQFAFGNKFDDAIAAVHAKEYTVAVSHFRDLAHLNHAPSQMNLAVMTAKGDGAIQDQKVALYWAWRARFSGEKRAVPLVEHLKSIVPQSDQDKIAHRLRIEVGELFENGRHSAAMELGRIYNEAFYPRDVETAYMWFNIASALDIKYAKAFREATGYELSSEAKARLQKNAKVTMTQWCIRQKTRPLLCEDIFNTTQISP